MPHRTITTTVALLLQLSLHSHYYAPLPLLFASSAAAAISDDNDIHEQHAHLTARAYGSGLRNKKRYESDDNRIIDTRDSRVDDDGEAARARRRPKKPDDKDDDDKTTRRGRRPRPNRRPNNNNNSSSRPPRRPGRDPVRDENKAKRKKIKKNKKKKDKSSNTNGSNRPNNRPDNNSKPSAASFGGSSSGGSSNNGNTNNRPNNNKPNSKPNSKSSASSFTNNSNPSKNNSSTQSSNGKLSSTALKALSTLSSISQAIDNSLFLYESPGGASLPSTIYQYQGLEKGLKVMNSQGVAGMHFYLGENTNSALSKNTQRALAGSNEHVYGLVNLAAFLAQSMKETIKYNACDENNWDLFGDGYPLSNACGQLGQSYQDYKCPKGEEHMECEVDLDMEITAVTHATWYGAPAPLFCKPKKDKNDFTGIWNYGTCCNNPWAEPPSTCDVYEGQKAGGFENDVPVPNRNGRTDVSGCCYWGRGVIQTTGICNFGKLNYYLGARAKKEGRPTPYGEIDFCKDPEAICSSTKFDELKWIAGMFYWMESVQKYDVGGWHYMDELHKFVDGGMQDKGFIDAVSGIVNRGCHNPPCGTGAVDGGPERYHNFVKALTTFGLMG